MKNGNSADGCDGCDGCHLVMERGIEWRKKRESIEKNYRLWLNGMIGLRFLRALTITNESRA